MSATITDSDRSASPAISWLAVATLLAIAACWGSTFYLIHDLMDRIPAVDFLAVRFAVATVTLLAIAPRAVKRLSRRVRYQALAVGGIYGVAQILQTEGLAHTSASMSGFLTGMYVVATPFLVAALLGVRVPVLTWLAVLLACTGLAVLTLGGVSFGYGEALTLGAAVLYALHIVVLGHWTRPGEAIGMATLQCLMVALICGAAAAPGGIVFPSYGGDWLALLYMAIAAGALALVGQTWAQSQVPATSTAIIFSMEPVFAAFFAVVLGGEDPTVRMLVGGGLMVTAMLVVELFPRRPVPNAAALAPIIPASSGPPTRDYPGPHILESDQDIHNNHNRQIDEVDKWS